MLPCSGRQISLPIVEKAAIRFLIRRGTLGEGVPWLRSLSVDTHRGRG
jgi:hypothetical protein